MQTPTPGSDGSKQPPSTSPEGTTQKLKRALFGAPRDIRDPRTYRHISLFAFLAWVGLGADGLSSSSCGPDGPFRAFGEHHFLAIGLALATAFIILRRLLPHHRTLPFRRRSAGSSGGCSSPD